MTAMTNPMLMFDVKDEVALITGASGAFGMVAARILAAAGCKLVLVAGNDVALAEIADECRGIGADVTTINKRPTDADICDDLVAQAVAAYGQLDILVVASGMNKVALINDMDPKTFTDVMDANVTQTWLLSRSAAGQMKAQGHPSVPIRVRQLSG
jgi:NAD(P)-dependent dehydrogenase (short-subunit alcohol dehydrogenase family)